MIEAFRKIWRFAGEETKNINKSVAVGFLNAVLQMFQVLKLSSFIQKTVSARYKSCK